ncbi:lipocalin-like domain-containing protein [Tenacibaculum sp. S7007]|uniref:Lipocalin-like domain-containing protein n=1 Tax=Tenacibaculum pelagium TaxID=2759527 RepID=A0A839AUR5_9FLAO|nr:lipocalin-like domain-containing protein [Tenacibaculum pelagium]
MGAWKLNTFNVRNHSLDKSIFPYGEQPIGILLFSKEKLMPVSIMADNQAPFSIE